MNELDLFTQALAHTDPAKRAAFLDQACAGNPDLRRRLDELLAGHARADSPLDQPPAAGATAALPPAPDAATGAFGATPPADRQTAPAVALGTVLAGRYTLVQKLGEGGMGEVWVASQAEPVRRQVALKVIKTGKDSKAVLARFEQERQALALMDHPNIARVYDGGSTAAGQPFFVMELVNGLPLTHFCDEARLTPRQRLELFLPICQAVQHAHQKGIIHRDLKPANILVTLIDGKPVPKVIDFGIAKATAGKLTDESLSTQFGAVLGTFEYMAPEQAGFSGEDIDTRADLYSLGVILYELLTGLRPLDAQRLKKAGLAEMVRVIREEEPSRPSTRLSTDASLPALAALRQTEPKKLAALLRGELDWVVMKCLEKQRDRRYETANALARDVQRYLADEPVEARPPSAGYRLGKFLKRHRGPVLAASLVLVALLAGILGTTWGLVEARRQEYEAKRQEQLARDEAAAKEQARAAEAVHRAVAEAQTRKALQAAAAEKAANDQAQKRLQQIEKANDLLGSIFQNLDPKEIARTDRPLQAILVAQLDRAVEQLEGEAVGDPVVVATLQDRFGRSLLALGAPGKAVVLLEKARATRQARLGPDDPGTLSTMNNLAAAYLEAGDQGRALDLFEETLRRSRARLGPEHNDTLSTMINLGCAYTEAGKLDLARPLLEEALGLAKARLGLDHTDTLNAMNNLARVNLEAGKLDLAVPLYEEALGHCKARFGPDEPDTLNAMHNLASAYQRAGKLDLAQPLFEETLRRRKARLGPDHPNTLATMNGLGVVYWRGKQLGKSIPLFEETLRRQEAKLGRGHEDTQLTVVNLGVNYRDAGRFKEALPLLEEAVRAAQKYPSLRGARVSLLNAYAQAGEYARAVPLVREYLPEARKQMPKDSAQLANLLAMGGAGLLELRHWDEAEPLLRECLAIRTKAQPDTWFVFNTQSQLGGALLGQKKYADAEPLLLAGYAGMKQCEKTIPSPALIRLPEALDRLIELYTATNRPDEVTRWRAERKQYPPPPQRK